MSTNTDPICPCCGKAIYLHMKPSFVRNDTLDEKDMSLFATTMLAMKELQSQLAERDALIERLIEVGEFFSGGFEHDAFGVLANGNWFEGCDEGTVRGREFLEEIQSRLHAIVTEWEAVKGEKK